MTVLKGKMVMPDGTRLRFEAKDLLENNGIIYVYRRGRRINVGRWCKKPNGIEITNVDGGTMLFRKGVNSYEEVMNFLNLNQIMKIKLFNDKFVPSDNQDWDEDL